MSNDLCMSNDLIVLSERADIFTRALINRIGDERLFWKTRKRVGAPQWNFQTTEVEVAPSGATPPEGAIIVEQTESVFDLQGPGGMAVRVWSTPRFRWLYAKNKYRARPAMFVADVDVDLSLYCSYSAASVELMLSASTSMPLPEEEDAHKALLEHIRALKKALKVCHFKVVNPSTSHAHGPVDDRPWIARECPNHDDPSMWSAGIYWVDQFTLERKKVVPFVDAVARLLDTPIASRIEVDFGEDRRCRRETGT